MVFHDNPYISLKYRFAEDGARSQLKRLVLEIMQTMAIKCGKRHGPAYVAGWRDYVQLPRDEVAALDEQIFKFARFVARLTGIDGAVVTTEGPELIGFGGIIQGTFEMGGEVARALDPEGKRKRSRRSRASAPATARSTISATGCTRPSGSSSPRTPRSGR